MAKRAARLQGCHFGIGGDRRVRYGIDWHMLTQPLVDQSVYTHTHARTRVCTHARKHTNTHKRTITTTATRKTTIHNRLWGGGRGGEGSLRQPDSATCTCTTQRQWSGRASPPSKEAHRPRQGRDTASRRPGASSICMGGVLGSSRTFCVAVSPKAV